MITFADVSEGVRATIARYTQALDDGRTDEVVDTFCPEGSIVLPGMGTHEGHDALRAAYDSWKPRRPQRHLVLNTLVDEWDDHEAAATSDVVLIVQNKEGAWSVGFVARYRDALRLDDGTWKFVRRTVSV